MCAFQEFFGINGKFKFFGLQGDLFVKILGPEIFDQVFLQRQNKKIRIPNEL
jgi:hypothetical protein